MPGIARDDSSSRRRTVTCTAEADLIIRPCFVFNYAEGFVKVTKWLAYNCSGHIIEKNPTKHRGLHLEPHAFASKQYPLLVTVDSL